MQPPGLTSQLLARAQAGTPQGVNGSAQGVARRRFLPSSYTLRVRRFDAPRLAVPVEVGALPPASLVAGAAGLVEVLRGHSVLVLVGAARAHVVEPGPQVAPERRIADPPGGREGVGVDPILAAEPGQLDRHAR